MSETTETQNDDRTPAQLREYAERQANEAKAERERADANAAAAKELAFIKAGITVSGKMAELAVKSYSGELNPDAITAYATEMGMVEAATPPPPPDEEARRELQEAHLAREAAATGSGEPNTAEKPKQPIWEEATANVADRIAKGDRLEDAQLHGMGTILAGARDGDESLKWTGWTAEERAASDRANR